MRKLYCFLLMVFITVNLQAQGLNIAKEFGDNLRMYVLTDSIDYREKIENLFNLRSSRIADDFMMALADHYGYPKQKSYMLHTYLNLIEKTIEKDKLSIEFSDFNNENESIVSNRHKSQVEVVSCRLKIIGSLSLDTKVLIIIRDGKITKTMKFVN